MGCGCKDDNLSSDLVNQDEIELNKKGNFLKIPTIIFLTLITILLSPLLIFVIWYVAISSVIADDFKLVDILLLKRFKKEVKEEDNKDDFNEDDYEIVGVDIIK
jgi:hypothetical protein